MWLDIYITKSNPVLSFGKKLMFIMTNKKNNRALASMGLEPMTFALLARRSNRLS